MSPLYTYRAAKDGCHHCGGEGFEEVEGVDDQPLATCPDCDCPVVRVQGRPGRNWRTERRLGESRSNTDLRKMGMKKYRKKPGGGYEREA